MPEPAASHLSLQPVDRTNWRAVRDLRVADEQRAFIADPNHYLAVCCYTDWNPLAIRLDERIIGFLMWAVDGEDGSCWLGGIFLDAAFQGQGLGKRSVTEAIAMLRERTGATEFALSYQPSNAVAKSLYASLGFLETGEVEEDEVAARMRT